MEAGSELVDEFEKGAIENSADEVHECLSELQNFIFLGFDESFPSLLRWEIEIHDHCWNACVLRRRIRPTRAFDSTGDLF